MQQICSTDEILERDRLAYWVDAVCSTFIHVDCEPKRDYPLRGEITYCCAEGLRMGMVTSTAQRITRSPRQIARDGVDAFNIALHLSGHALMSQDGRGVTLGPGDLVLHDSSRPWQLAFDGAFSQLVLQVPRTELMCRLGTVKNLGALRIDGTRHVGLLLSQALQQLPSQIDAIPASIRARLAENLLDLTVTAVLGQEEWASRTCVETTLAHVKQWIEIHLAEDLSAERIASECRVSARHINRLFQREQTTLMGYVWKRRLARCHRNLADPSMRHRSITELAFAVGFNDLSHFSRAYRTRYGCTPREARRQST